MGRRSTLLPPYARMNQIHAEARVTLEENAIKELELLLPKVTPVEVEVVPDPEAPAPVEIVEQTPVPEGIRGRNNLAVILDEATFDRDYKNSWHGPDADLSTKDLVLPSDTPDPVIIDDVVVEPVVEEAPVEEPIVEEEAVLEDATPEWNTKMSKQELVDIGSKLGLDLNVDMSKTKILRALENHAAEALLEG